MSDATSSLEVIYVALQKSLAKAKQSGISPDLQACSTTLSVYNFEFDRLNSMLPPPANLADLRKTHENVLTECMKIRKSPVVTTLTGDDAAQVPVPGSDDAATPVPLAKAAPDAAAGMLENERINNLRLITECNALIQKLSDVAYHDEWEKFMRREYAPYIENPAGILSKTQHDKLLERLEQLKTEAVTQPVMPTPAVAPTPVAVPMPLAMSALQPPSGLPPAKIATVGSGEHSLPRVDKVVSSVVTSGTTTAVPTDAADEEEDEDIFNLAVPPPGAATPVPPVPSPLGEHTAMPTPAVALVPEIDTAVARTAADIAGLVPVYSTEEPMSTVIDHSLGETPIYSTGAVSTLPEGVGGLVNFTAEDEMKIVNFLSTDHYGAPPPPPRSPFAGVRNILRAAVAGVEKFVNMFRGKTPDASSLATTTSVTAAPGAGPSAVSPDASPLTLAFTHGAALRAAPAVAPTAATSTATATSPTAAGAGAAPARIPAASAAPTSASPTTAGAGASAAAHGAGVSPAPSIPAATTPYAPGPSTPLTPPPPPLFTPEQLENVEQTIMAFADVAPSDGHSLEITGRPKAPAIELNNAEIANLIGATMQAIGDRKVTMTISDGSAEEIKDVLTELNACDANKNVTVEFGPGLKEKVASDPSFTAIKAMAEARNGVKPGSPFDAVMSTLPSISLPAGAKKHPPAVIPSFTERRDGTVAAIQDAADIAATKAAEQVLLAEGAHLLEQLDGMIKEADNLVAANKIPDDKLEEFAEVTDALEKLKIKRDNNTLSLNDTQIKEIKILYGKFERFKQLTTKQSNDL